MRSPQPLHDFAPRPGAKLVRGIFIGLAASAPFWVGLAAALIPW